MDKKQKVNDENVVHNFGSLGSVTVVQVEDQVVDVYAKYDGSPYPTGGAPYSDDALTPTPYVS